MMDTTTIKIRIDKLDTTLKLNISDINYDIMRDNGGPYILICDDDKAMLTFAWPDILNDIGESNKQDAHYDSYHKVYDLGKAPDELKDTCMLFEHRLNGIYVCYDDNMISGINDIPYALKEPCIDECYARQLFKNVKWINSEEM